MLSFISIAADLAISTQAKISRSCGHCQSTDWPSVQESYDAQHQTSLQSEQHDRIYLPSRDKFVSRIQHLAEMLAAIRLPLQARCLSFGLIKGTTLRTLLPLRPDLRPLIFNVSNDYVKFR